MPTLGNALDFAKYEARNIRGHQLGAAPSSPVSGQLYYNTSDNTLYWFDGTTWQSAKGGTGTPTGAAGGDLEGNYPNPEIKADAVTNRELLNDTITSGKINSAHLDGAAGVYSMRRLGTGSTQAAAGNDSRLSDARVPTAHKATHEPGGSDPMTVDAAAATGSLRTLGLTGNKAMPGVTTLDAVPSPTSSVNMNNQRLNLVGDPTLSTDAANKKYVDGLITGAAWKNPVRLVATVNVGASPPGGPQTIDGVAVANGDRVLLTAQTAPKDNGIWGVNTGGTWGRVGDADTGPEMVNAAVFVAEGTVNADTAWVCTTNAPITIDTTPITFVQFSSLAQLVAGGGLTKTGSTVDVGAGPGITVNADTVQVANNGITNAMLADGAVDLATADVTGTLNVGKGGTGAATPAQARTNLGTPGIFATSSHAAGTTISIPRATHNLRMSMGLMVQCQIEATGQVILPDITINVSGDVTITFGASQGANTILTTIYG